MCSAVLVSGAQHGDSVMHTHVLFQALFRYRLFPGIACGPLCCAVYLLYTQQLVSSMLSLPSTLEHFFST